MKMTDSEYNSFLKIISNWTGTKEELQALYDRIAATYDDASELLRRLDQNQYKWRMNTH